MGTDEEILSRLARGDIPEAQADLVVAALISDDELARTLTAADGMPASRPVLGDTHDELREPKRVYLSKITVAGFRGIGQAAELELKPGPGLTLVTGRNGSGKSSFAEAAELALTGVNKRWDGSGHAVERDGWRNLHSSGQARIDVELAVNGVPNATTVTREWAEKEGLDSGTSYVQTHGRPRDTIDSLGWSTAMELYRPFLSYAELGALVNSGKPAQMHDALERILGLDQLKDADKRLDGVRKDLDAKGKRAKDLLPALRVKLDGHADERAATALAELAKRAPDLDMLSALASGGDDTGGNVAARLRQVVAITLPSADSVSGAIDAVSAAERRVAELAGTPAADARRLAGLLRAALDHQADHDGGLCPVCGGGTLDAAWAEGARAEAERLTSKASEAEQADSALAQARRMLEGLVPQMPAALTQDLGEGLDPRAAEGAWTGWTTIRSAEKFFDLELEVGLLKEQAGEALRKRAEAWQPAAVAIAEWVATERASRDAAAKLGEVRKAIEWLKKAGGELRNERLRPFRRRRRGSGRCCGRRATSSWGR